MNVFDHQISYRTWRDGILLGFILSVVLTVSASSAATVRTPCMPNEAQCRLSGGFSAVSVTDPAPGQVGITHPSSFAYGALIYEDFVALENRARALLEKGLRMRESISPYKDNNSFETHLRKLDATAGWEDKAIDMPKPGYESATTFAELITQIQADLTEARDLYAFLIVFAPEARFRADSSYINSNPEHLVALCGATDKEDPNPKADPTKPTVLPPVIDWCNFRARLRQSVREVANVRMIVGQEFMVDALGVNFSGNFVGGEALVKKEVAQLRAARHQFEKAEEFLTGALKIAVGNGCLISDFYTQTEWALLSLAAERQGTAQHHIATRESYLDSGSAQSVAQAQLQAQQTFRQTSNDAHLKLIALAGLGVPAGGCTIGEHPDGNLVAEMALNQLETKRQSQEMAAGLNIFGFDVTMTPARPYISSSPRNCDTLAQGDRGLWDEAWCSAKLAEALQNREENATRFFDTSQEKLNEAVQTIRQGLDFDIDNAAGCTRSSFPSDDDFFACAQKQIDEAEECWRLASFASETDGTKLEPAAKYNNFDTCMKAESAGGNIKDRNDSYTALAELRSIYLEYQAIEKSAKNIAEQIQNSNDANAIVTEWLNNAGIAETAAEVTQALLDAFTCIDFTDGGIGTSNTIGACAALAGANGVAQIAAGAVSTEADVKIANAENEKEIKNLLLQQSELLIAAQAAQQAFFAKSSDVGGLIDRMRRDLKEAQRQRAYFAASPANDPSFRIVRDSARIELAAALERAARISYLAARRAEYEYAARLAASGFRISDIYRARTAQDILQFLNTLQGVTSSLAGSTTRDTTPIDLKISIAKDLLLLTDELLMNEGFTTPAAIATERTRRFRQWVSVNTITNPEDNKPALKYTFSTSLLDGGIFANVFSQAYHNHWLLKLSGVGTPIATSNGVSINLVSEENNLSHRKVIMSQGGLVHMSSYAGCVFDYRLIAPAKLLGREWPANQNAESVTATFNANVNDSHPYTENGYRTPAFEGQAISATDWAFTVFAGTPQASLGLPDMDLQQLTDIELHLSVVYASRSDDYTAPPEPSACARIDY